MGKGKATEEKTRPAPKNKKIVKREADEDSIFFMKKEATGKEVVVRFPMICTTNGKLQRAIPMFRKDARVGTPAFGLPDQMTDQYAQEQEAMHRLRVSSEEFEIPAQKIKQAKPSSRNSYCTICKLRFDDYKEHINTSDHLFQMRQSSFNEFILQMCSQYARETERLIAPCNSETDLESLDRQVLLLEKRKSSEEQKQKLYTSLKEMAKSTRGISENSELYDVIEFV